MAGYKAGERIILTERYDSLKKGMRGRIVIVDHGDETLLICFDNWHQGHDGGVLEGDEEYSGYWVRFERVKLENRTIKQRRKENVL